MSGECWPAEIGCIFTTDFYALSDKSKTASVLGVNRSKEIWFCKRQFIGIKKASNWRLSYTFQCGS